MMKKTLPLMLTSVLVLAACGGGGSDDANAFDNDRACRIGERLVEETAAGDQDGVTKQIDRLDELDGIADSDIDVRDLDDIAQGLDQNAVDDLISEFDSIACDLEAPDVDTTVDSAPIDTTDVSDPIVTDPVDTTVDTDPVTTEPVPVPTDATPGTTTAPVPPAGGATGTPVDVGSTGPGGEAGVGRPTESVIAEFQMAGILFSPNTSVVELRISRQDSTFSDEVTSSSSDSITMSATTPSTLEEIRASYRAAIEALGVAYDFTESTSSSDGTNTVGLQASPSEFDSTIASWDLTVTQDDDTPGVATIEVDRSIDQPGAIPAIPAPATELLQATADIGTNLGWTVSGFRYSESSDTFDGELFTSGSVDWNISEENTVRASATALQDAVGLPIDNEEVEDDRISWFLADDSFTLFSVSYYEFGGTTATFSP